MSCMKKRVLAILFLFVLAGCPATRDAEVPRPTDFRFGTEGIHMEFVPNLPPPELFDREDLNVLLQVENRGTSNVGFTGRDAIFLSGFDNTIITGIPLIGVSIPPLEGRGPFLPQGGIDTVSVTGTIRSLSGLRLDKYEPTILATACYNYETLGTAQICIDPDPFAPTAVERVCVPSTVSPGSQGAPIAVTTVELQTTPGKTRFAINIQNVGRGDVFRMGDAYLNLCSPYTPGLTFKDINYVRVDAVTVSGLDIRNTCKPLDATGHIRLTNGQAQLFCEFIAPQIQSAYLTPINVILRYGYRQSIAKRIIIRPVS